MIAQLLLSLLLVAMLLYAWHASRQVPLIALSIGLAGLFGLYFVWVPEQANVIAEWIGIGRGADLFLYLWVIVSLLFILQLHLKLRAQLDLLTRLARHIALAEAKDGKGSPQAGP